jgi:hypothetical protein
MDSVRKRADRLSPDMSYQRHEICTELNLLSERASEIAERWRSTCLTKSGSLLGDPQGEQPGIWRQRRGGWVMERSVEKRVG